MSLMDDLKKKTEDGLKTLRETAEGIAFNVEKQAKIAGRKMDLLRFQRKLQRLYAEVGEYAYGEFTAERPIQADDVFLKNRVALISAMKAEMRQIEAEIEEVRGTYPPGREEKAGEEKSPPPFNEPPPPP